MTNTNDARKAHKLLDDIANGYPASVEEVNHLRNFLPERPKGATLEELLTRVHAAWLSANPSDWGFDTPAEHHDWLFDLRNDLVRIIEEQDEPANTPAHPEFLETEADYAAAPEGTIVAEDGGTSVRVKTYLWPELMVLTVKRRVLRWGYGNE